MAFRVSPILRKWGLDSDSVLSIGVLALLILTLFPFLILSFYNHPSLDDFAFTNVEMKNGFFGAQKYWYLTWTGRYFSTALLSLNPLVFHIYRGYKMNAFILVSLLVIVTYWLSGRIFKRLDKTGRALITSLFIFSYIMLLPKVSTAIYWETTSYQYLASGILTFCLLGCIISYYNFTHKRRYFIISSLLLIALIGCHEITMVFMDLFILWMLLFSILRKQKLFFPMILFVVCIIFSVIEITAPGNNKRELLMYHDSHILKYSIKESFLYGKDLIIEWMPFMFFTGILLFALLSNRVLWNEVDESILSIPPWFSLMACLAIPVIGLFILYWSMGWIPVRVLNIICFYFVAGMMYFSFSLIAKIKKRYPDSSLSIYMKLSLLPVFLIVLYFNKNSLKTNNITLAYKDIVSGSASAYNKQRIEENDSLVNSQSDSSSIPSITQSTSSLFFIELPQPTEERDSLGKLINYSFFQYYHRKHIGVKEK